MKVATVKLRGRHVRNMPSFPVSLEKQVGASMSNEDEKPMTEDQATDLKVATKLKKQGYENGLSKAEADKRIKEV